MKMDATQKQRMWKVAVVHFALTLFIFVSAAINAPLPFWLVKAAIYYLQPQTILILKPTFHWIGFHWHLSEWIYDSILFTSIPIWSICFSWLYVKFTNWLNHFPVLGKKVF
jgi:hypothetical protein